MELTTTQQAFTDLSKFINDRREFHVSSLVHGVPEDFNKYQYIVGSLHELEVFKVELDKIFSEYFQVPNVKHRR